MLATFEDPNTLATVADVKADPRRRRLGRRHADRRAASTLAVQQIGVDPANGDPIFEVLGSHTYAEETPRLPNTLSVIVTTLGARATTVTTLRARPPSSTPR